jgi:hypothetical protein
LSRIIYLIYNAPKVEFKEKNPCGGFVNVAKNSSTTHDRYGAATAVSETQDDFRFVPESVGLLALYARHAKFSNSNINCKLNSEIYSSNFINRRC